MSDYFTTNTKKVSNNPLDNGYSKIENNPDNELESLLSLNLTSKDTDIDGYYTDGTKDPTIIDVESIQKLSDALNSYRGNQNTFDDFNYIKQDFEKKDEFPAASFNKDEFPGASFNMDSVTMKRVESGIYDFLDPTKATQMAAAA